MSPIDYLRAMVKRDRKPATGGLVTPQWTPDTSADASASCTLTVDNSESRYTQPTRIATYNGAVSEAEADAMRTTRERTHAADATYPIPTHRPKAPDTIPVLCPCLAIYSECRCAPTNIGDQTTTAHFHADQQ